MRLENSLYRVVSSAIGENEAHFRIELEGDNFIYKAHFPGEPVTPGVCICQIVCELAEKIKKRGLKLVQVKNIKFLAPISPEEVSTPEVTLEVTDSEECATVKARIEDSGKVFAKLSLILK